MSWQRVILNANGKRQETCRISRRIEDRFEIATFRLHMQPEFMNLQIIPLISYASMKVEGLEVADVTRHR